MFGDILTRLGKNLGLVGPGGLLEGGGGDMKLQPIAKDMPYLQGPTGLEGFAPDKASPLPGPAPMEELAGLIGAPQPWQPQQPSQMPPSTDMSGKPMMMKPEPMPSMSLPAMGAAQAMSMATPPAASTQQMGFSPRLRQLMQARPPQQFMRRRPY